MQRPGPSVRTEIREVIEAAIERATGAGLLPEIPSNDRPAIEVSYPADAEHGDLSTNLALKLAKPLHRPPMAIAGALVEVLRQDIGGAEADEHRARALVSAEVAAPGFVNMRLSPAYLELRLDDARAAGSRYGHVVATQPSTTNVEFVSANPTGPLTVGNARGAFVGDLLSRLLEAGGHSVTREYYFNDSGRQVEMLGASVAASRMGEPIPEEGYHGGYVAGLARDLPEEQWARAIEHGTDRDELIGKWASERVRAGIEASLEHLGVHFDVWKSEASLHTEGWVSRGIERLREAGHLYEQDGALWFRSTTFGDDKDRPIIRSNGQPVYFASDIGYVSEKFSRGFDRLIYVWGADHHGTVARVRNAAQAMGYHREAVRMLLIAWVHFVRDGQEISMSKRSGEFITLDELLSEVGVDAARWYFASRAYTTGIDFDIEAAKDQSAANPVHYVRYAHARICSILRKASQVDLQPAGSMVGAVVDDEVSKALALAVLRLPEVVEDAAAAMETHGVTSYATDLASTFHAYYRDRRVLDTADPETSALRLALVDATRQTLASTLGLLGISAPQSM